MTNNIKNLYAELKREAKMYDDINISISLSSFPNTVATSYTVSKLRKLYKNDVEQIKADKELGFDTSKEENILQIVKNSIYK